MKYTYTIFEALVEGKLIGYFINFRYPTMPESTPLLDSSGKRAIFLTKEDASAKLHRYLSKHLLPDYVEEGERDDEDV